MSAVDVLADLRSVVRIAKAASVGVGGNAPRIERAEAAIAAVAELMTVLSETQDALLAYDGHVSNPMYAEGWSDQEGYKAYARANSILARCKGEQA